VSEEFDASRIFGGPDEPLKKKVMGFSRMTYEKFKETVRAGNVEPSRIARLLELYRATTPTTGGP
jgi:hypothetical protein